MKVKRLQLTAPLSHLCLLIPPLFSLLSLLFLHLLLFLLPPSAAEAVQATEAGTGEGHGLSEAPHPRSPEGKREKRGGRGRGGVKTFSPSSGDLPRHHAAGEERSLLNTRIHGIKAEEKGFHSFMHIEAKRESRLELLTELCDDKILPYVG